MCWRKTSDVQKKNMDTSLLYLKLGLPVPPGEMADEEVKHSLVECTQHSHSGGLLKY
jgi:hypothetical protein